MIYNEVETKRLVVRAQIDLDLDDITALHEMRKLVGNMRGAHNDLAWPMFNLLLILTNSGDADGITFAGVLQLLVKS